ncbi:MAG: SPX domain-containing protein [Linnemannia elongata]|nr:MAG: SPX domain-containing protein [Linnemannia elongata]
MKFAKQLQEEVVPEWRKAYMNYKQGKKYLKAIEAALDQLDDNNQNAHLNNIKHHEPLSIDTEAASSIERPATVYSPKYPDSPTGTTPIIKKGRGSQRSYDTIHRPPPRSGTLPLPSSSLDSALDGTDQGPAVPHDPQQHQLAQRPSIATLTDRQVPPRRDSFVAQIGEAARNQSHNVLKSLQRSLTMVAMPPQRRLKPRAINLEGRPLDSIKGLMLEEERAFFQFLEGQLEMVDAFYKAKELESVTKLKVLKQQLYVADEWKRRQDIRKAKAEAQRGWYQAEWSRVKNGLGSFMGDPTHTEDVTIGPLHRPHLDPLDQVKHTTVGFSTGAVTIIPRSGVVNNGKARKNSLRFRDNRATVDGHPVCTVSELNQVVIDDEENRRQHLNHKVARSRIKAAIYEFYRSMEMLKNYRVLNKTGFVKIMKKFDKTAGWKASKDFQASKLKPAYFISSTILDDLILETEDLYVAKFEKGHHRRGMAKLRIPTDRNKPNHSTIARVGLYIGIALPLLILGLKSALSEDTESVIPFWSSLLLVYAGLFLTVLFACLFGINIFRRSL